jgi:glycine/D-amino acid oxidase-like deaminating enzyme
MKHEIFWKNPGYEVRPELKEDIECDYLIVGGGVAGVSTAYFLSKLGAKNIVLIEKNEIASGATGKAAGSLVVRGESDLVDYIKIHGPETGEKYWHQIRDTLKRLHQVTIDENVDCDAEPQDTLYVGYESKGDIDLLEEYNEEKKIDPLARFVEGVELKRELNTPVYNHGIVSVEHGLSVNPLKLTQNLSVALEKKYGVKVYEHTTYLSSDDHTAFTRHGKIKFKKMALLVDTDHPDLRVKVMRTSIVVTRPLTDDELATTGFHKKKIVWDSMKDYHYFKLTKDNRILFGYGLVFIEKELKSNDLYEEQLERIKEFLSQLFPYLENLEIEYAWTGNMGATEDYEPHFKFDGDTIEMAGAGTQVVCFMAGEHIAKKFLGLASPFEDYFPG